MSGHMRFVGATIYCPSKKQRFNLGDDHQYGQEFICPGCSIRVDATDYFKANPPRRNVQITATKSAAVPPGAAT